VEFKYLVFDVETTGLGEEADLLTVWFGVFNKNFEQLDTLYLPVKPDSGIYRVQVQGMEVNKINLIEHDKVALPYKEAKTVLYNFLQKNAIGDELIPLGQNVIFDIEFLCRTIISSGSWESLVSRRVLDTMHIARFLQLNGKLPNCDNVGLKYLTEYFGIYVKGNPHEAKYDALCTLEIYKKLVEIIK
jgi:DNA polymerase III alpha subunit (gram-positive type)